MRKTAIIYARVSTVRQADDGLPVESQIDQCHAKAQAIGAEVLRVFRDDGISGRSPRRPGFTAAMDFCERNSVDCFICWSTSRFGRDQLDAGLNKRLLEKMGVRLVYASQEFGDDDEGWLAESITSVIDEMYSRKIAKDTRRSMVRNARDGFFCGSWVPFGFRSVPAGKRRRLEIEPEEAGLVRTMFRWCMEGAGTKAIAVRLNESGITKRGRRWDKASVSTVLKSRTNIGQIVYRVGDEEITTQAHEAIISDEDFAVVQEMMEERAPRNAGGRPRSEAVFSGMLRCGACGDAMTTETATGRGGVRYHYYNCRAWLKGVGCRSRRVPVVALDEWLLAGILDRIFTPENIRDLVASLKADAGRARRDRAAHAAAITKERTDVERRLRRLYETVEAGAGLELADVAPRIRELTTRRAQLAREADEMAAAPPSVTVEPRDIATGVEVFRGMVERCEDPKRVREFLSGIVRRVILEDHEARVEYFPERISMPAIGGSQCEVRWLPDLATLRTARIPMPPRGWRRRAA